MKLWQKIFLCTLGLVIIGINLVTVILLGSQHKLLIEQSKDSAMSSHGYVANNIKNSILYERLRQKVVIFQEEEVLTIIDDLFKSDMEEDNYKTTEINSISLYDTTQCKYQNGKNLSAYVEPVLTKITQANSYYIDIVDEGYNTQMILASTITLEGKDYYLITTYDITSIYNIYGRQLELVKKISIYSGLAIAGILLIVIRFLLLPLQAINAGTRQIAKGKYETRIHLTRRDELSELAQNMNTMAKAIEKNVNSLEQVARDRKDFIDNLSHEMKTPLTSILGFADILRMKRTVTEGERQEYAGIIVEEAKRMKILSGKLMEMISIGNTQIDLEEVSLKDVATEVATVFHTISNTHGITLSTDLRDGIIKVDRELFKSLLYNVLDNALKASTEGGIIDFTTKIQKDVAILTIRDHGIGMTPEELDRIQEPFYMVDKSRSRKYGGAGLGLALCTEIAKVHDAKLLFESQAGEGTKVIIEMKGRKDNG